MRKLWTQAAAHWLRLTLLWRSGHVLAALFYFCAAQQMTETPDANMPGTWKHIIANHRPGKETSRIDRTAIPTSPFGLKNMRSGRATAQQAGMDFSSSFRPYRRVRFRLPRFRCARKISPTEPARHELTNMLPAGGVGTASARTAQERKAGSAARQDSIADDRLAGRIA